LWWFDIVLTVLLEAQDHLELPWEIPELARSSSRFPVSIPVEVSDRSYRRLTRFAALSVAHLVALAVAAASPGWGGAGVLLVWLLLLPAIGPFQAEVALNPTFDEDERRRWRIALYVLPWSMTLYWHRYVRR
jgi:hypothetical protein